MIFDNFVKAGAAAHEARADGDDDTDADDGPTPSAHPPPPTGLATTQRGVLHACVSSAAFTNVTLSLIVLNTIAMCSERADATPEWDEALEQLNTLFTLAFVLEAALKIGGLGVRGYFASRWNVFDFGVTAASAADLALALIAPRFDGSLLRALRVARILRLLRVNPRMARFESLLAHAAVPVLNIDSEATVLTA